MTDQKITGQQTVGHQTTGEQITEPQRIAEQCAQRMLELDQAAKSLGISIETIRPGHVTITMTVTGQMLNGHKTCHGGFLFTLADCAFALACNSYNKTTVAASCDITFVRPGHQGDRLTATAAETHKAGRSGIYDVVVTDQHNETIALFRGKSRTISKTGPLDDS